MRRTDVDLDLVYHAGAAEIGNLTPSQINALNQHHHKYAQTALLTLALSLTALAIATGAIHVSLLLFPSLYSITCMIAKSYETDSRYFEAARIRGYAGWILSIGGLLALVTIGSLSGMTAYQMWQ